MVSAVLGVLWGLVPFHGLLAIILYVAIITVSCHLYVTVYQGVDEESVGGFWELAKAPSILPRCLRRHISAR